MKREREEPAGMLFGVEETQAIAEGNAKDHQTANRRTAASLTKEISHGRTAIRSITGPLFADQCGLFDDKGGDA